MNNSVLENKYLRVEVSAFGAELQSVRNKETGFEYLWHGDKKYWGRRSPILFPIVGKLWQGKMRYEGNEYSMGQHGFARDMEFLPMSSDDLLSRLSDRGECGGESVGFVLTSDSDTRSKFPFDFRLCVMYRLDGNNIHVYWEVENSTDGDMWFQIGAHPAFNYKDFDTEADVQAYLKFDKDTLSLTHLVNGGYASAERTVLELGNNILPINERTLAGDALVMERQISRIELQDRSRKTYVDLKFDAPAVGIWSPGESYAPFVCLEPWYGRCDDNEFNGEYSEKAYVNHLGKGEVFKSKYTISLS